MADQAVPTETETQSESKKASVPAAPAAVPAANPLAASTSQWKTAPSKVPSSVEVTTTGNTTATKKSNNTGKAAIPAAIKAGVPAAAKSSPSSTKYALPIPTKGAPVLPPVAIHHPYAHHHYYAYHQHMAATAKANANAKDPKKAGKPATAKPAAVPSYNPAQYKKAAGEKGKAGVAAAGPPPPMYPPPPPHLPPHHHAYQAWAAYRYAQQHSQYHGGPPPPGAMPPWNADAYAAAHQAYAAAAKTAAAATGKGNNTNKKGTTGENGAAGTGTAVGAPTLPPHHHYPPHGGPPPAGPYRYSDPTLRRDALSRISSTSESSKAGTTTTKGSSPSSLPSHSNLSNSPSTPGSAGVAKAVMVGANHTPPDPATLHMLELEARAEGATSPSQIEDFHREEVTTMGCTCKKTKCLKLYCQCFAVKIYCGANCRCMTCNNTPMHEEVRQEAIRTILSRNPTAFDTKFQKNNRKIAPPIFNGIIPPAANANAVHGMDIPHARTISHKLGCKCRKSACIKKYCECYAGNVKCSINCRCVGCKNMPPGGFGPPPASGKSVANPAPVKLTPTKKVMTTPVKKEPSWMMSAAQNLAFMKHGSAEKPKRIISRAPSEAGSMPSLASSSEDSPISKARTKSLTMNGARTMAAPSTAERAAVDALKSSEKTAVNALLMAAMAMTEMAGDTGATPNRENRQDASTKNGTTLVSSTAAASPLNNRESNNGNSNSPEATNRSVDFETPQRNLLKKFMSPKRKVSDRNAEEESDILTSSYDEASKLPSRNLASAYREKKDDYDDDEDSPKREHPGDGTPSLLQKVKRSRLGSLKKGARLLERENSNGDQSLLEGTSSGAIPMEMSTPAKATGGVNMADLTPVSARCIDFKKMHVNDSRSDPAVVDSGAH
eukprot:CAMPEP_0116151352 /NCGR_PEP_ID=MMETSP0329-20121206/20047_1 /TAXON_ID=697910 /ORGANISM="Pseudo-nitzschia arenysensis, Strain B593" /LENGTH=890 /DNA_ID=CAMNT_0003647951 /DNA_START=314 /DNA_END=2986 /DNA_ORIENTATION=+